jgi:hypothetical protein
MKPIIISLPNDEYELKELEFFIGRSYQTIEDFYKEFNEKVGINHPHITPNRNGIDESIECYELSEYINNLNEDEDSDFRENSFYFIYFYIFVID